MKQKSLLIGGFVLMMLAAFMAVREYAATSSTIKMTAQDDYKVKLSRKSGWYDTGIKADRFRGMGFGFDDKFSIPAYVEYKLCPDKGLHGELSKSDYVKWPNEQRCNVYLKVSDVYPEDQIEFRLIMMRGQQ